jgi:hypothetical protein
MLEETGYTIKRMEWLGNAAPDTGLFASQACVYLAVLESDDKQEATDAAEAICSVELISFADVKRLMANGEITDGYTLSAFALYWAKEV